MATVVTFCYAMRLGTDPSSRYFKCLQLHRCRRQNDIQTTASYKSEISRNQNATVSTGVTPSTSSHCPC